MSKTLYVDFRNNGFWAFDVVSSVFLKYLIDAANEHLAQGGDEWLTDAISHWRFNAECSDCGLYLDSDWTSAQTETVIALCRTAVQKIRDTGDISESVVASWLTQDKLDISTRGVDPVPCESVARFGNAIADLLNNTLPDPPDGHWWFFTHDDELKTIINRK